MSDTSESWAQKMNGTDEGLATKTNDTGKVRTLKRVLVVGENSYIGDNFAKYASGRMCVDIVDSYEGWKTVAFCEYDCVLMVAGVAHQKWNRKQQAANKDRYFAINRDLAIAVAEKAKAGGVGQFMYLSSMAVYGRTEGAITANTKVSPRVGDYYGRSKYEAEEALASLFMAGQVKPHSLEGDAGGSGLAGDGDRRSGTAECDMSHNMPSALCIVRPPMVYGPDCHGKFATLVKVAKKIPVIPKVNNRRSMIFIDNLCEFLCLAVEERISGVFHPHNKEYMNTTWLIKAVAEAMGKRRLVVPGLGWAIRLAMPFSAAIKTAFGSLYYDDMATMPFDKDYQVVSAEESVDIVVSRSIC